MKVKSESEDAQLCPTLSDPMDRSLPGCSVHGIFRQEYWSGLPLPSLKWTGMGELNSDDHYIYYCGQESFRRNGVAIKVNNVVLGGNLKSNRMISVRFQGKPFNITAIQVYAPTSNAEEAEVE